MKIEWKTERRKVRDLLPADYNPRTMSDTERADLEASIVEFGQVVPVVVNVGKRKNTLIGGHQRVGIYADLGHDIVDVMVPSRELTLKEEKRLNLRLNKNVGGWDWSKLGSIDLETLVEVGFGEEELATLWDDVDMLDDDFDVNRAVKDIVTPKSKPGDVYQLGEHRIMCGDCTQEAEVAKLLKTDTIDIIFCDPPRGKKETDHSSLVDASLSTAFIHTANAHIFCWATEKTLRLGLMAIENLECTFKNVLMWVKGAQSINPKVAFTGVYQPCIYAVKGDPKAYGKNMRVTGILNKEVASDNQLVDDILSLSTMWVDRKDAGEEKPVTLAERPLKRCSAPGQVVYVPFGRGGAMVIACEQINRKARVMERDAVLVDVIVERWETFTNKKAKKL